MLVFSTLLPLNPSISQEKCIQLFIEWIIESEHYPINSIPYDVGSHKDLNIIKDNISFSITHYKDNEIELSACRLENNETNFTWINDCVFLQEGQHKSLLIQLNCNSLDFKKTLPLIHRPYIVRKFVESGLCSNDDIIPTTDKPIAINNNNIELCRRIMCNELQNLMPVVYISCDYWGNTVLDAEKLAMWLGGVAHVLVEANHNVALALKDLTDGRNAHNGYIGIYFPKTEYYEKFCIDYYTDIKALTKAVIDAVWSALINRIDNSVYNWNQIKTLQARQEMFEWKNISEADKQRLDNYINTFDSEKDELEKKVDVLNGQNMNLRARLDALQAAIQEKKNETGLINMGCEHDLYTNEHTELICNILEQVKSKFDEKSRGRTIIESLLAVNSTDHECERIFNELKTIFYNSDRLNASSKSKLRDLGFKIEEDGGTHYKLTFHDPRYMFSVAKTPSDHREGRNLYSDISKVLDFTKKTL